MEYKRGDFLFGEESERINENFGLKVEFIFRRECRCGVVLDEGSIRVFIGKLFSS